MLTLVLMSTAVRPAYGTDLNSTSDNLPHAAQSPQCEHAIGAVQPDDAIATPFGEYKIDEPEAVLLLKDQTVISAALKLKGAERKHALRRYFSQRARTRLEKALVFVNYSMALYIGAHVASGLSQTPQSTLTAVALLIPTLFTADLMSGIQHKFLDSYASETNPIWGSAARAYRIHHEFPSNLNDLSYLENVAAFSPLLAPLFAATAMVAPHLAPEYASNALLMLLLFANGTEIHRQAHLPKPRSWVRALQNAHLLLSREQHMLHHPPGTDTDFGIINGWSNRIVGEGWNRIDRILWRTLRKLPNNWIQHPASIPPEVISDLIRDLGSVPQRLLVAAANARSSDERTRELLAAKYVAGAAEPQDPVGGDE